MAPKPKRGVEMTEQVIVRLTSEEKVLLQKAAERLNMTISDYVRYLCLPVVNDVQTGGTPAQFKERVSGTLSGTADYFSARYQASQYEPSFETYTFKTVNEGKGEEQKRENEG